MSLQKFLAGHDGSTLELSIPPLVEYVDGMSIVQYRSKILWVRTFSIRCLKASGAILPQNPNPRRGKITDEGGNRYSFPIYFGEKIGSLYMKVTVFPNRNLSYD